MGVCARKKRRCRYSSVEVDMSDTIKMRPREYIKIRGANEHNLKAIDIDIPRNEFVVLTGLSGSG